MPKQILPPHTPTSFDIVRIKQLTLNIFNISLRLKISYAGTFTEQLIIVFLFQNLVSVVTPIIFYFVCLACCFSCIPSHDVQWLKVDNAQCVLHFIPNSFSPLVGSYLCLPRLASCLLYLGSNCYRLATPDTYIRAMA